MYDIIYKYCIIKLIVIAYNRHLTIVGLMDN